MDREGERGVDDTVIPEIEALVEVYKEFYRPARYCGCTEEHPYPHNVDSDGKPAVCLAHEWERQQRIMQRLLVQRELSLPIPPGVRWSEKDASVVKEAMKKVDLYANPATTPSKLSLKGVSDDGSVATSIAWYLTQAEWEDDTAKRQHIVVYLDRSTIINNTFAHRDLEMRAAVTYAPVLIYWDNRDNRNGSWILNAIRSRPNGLAFVVK